MHLPAESVKRCGHGRPSESVGMDVRLCAVLAQELDDSLGASAYYLRHHPN